MQLRNNAERFGLVSQALHWSVALLVLALLPIGWYMTGLPLNLEKFRLYELHKSLGLLVLGIMVVRLIWRRFNPPPPLPTSMAGWERFAAHATHWALYAGLFLQALFGILLTWKANSALTLFGWFTLASPLEPDEDLAKTISLAHFWLGNAIVSLVILHIAAAFRHHFIRKDDILRRMLPKFGTAQSAPDRVGK